MQCYNWWVHYYITEKWQSPWMTEYDKKKEENWVLLPGTKYTNHGNRLLHML